MAGSLNLDGERETERDIWGYRGRFGRQDLSRNLGDLRFGPGQIFFEKSWIKTTSF